MDAKDKAKVLVNEIKRRLDNYEKLHTFVTELATWDGTTDSWYSLFKNYQAQAKSLVEKM